MFPTESTAPQQKTLKETLKLFKSTKRAINEIVKELESLSGNRIAEFLIIFPNNSGLMCFFLEELSQKDILLI